MNPSLRISCILKVKGFLPPLMSIDLSLQHHLLIKMGPPILTLGEKKLWEWDKLFHIIKCEKLVKRPGYAKGNFAGKTSHYKREIFLVVDLSSVPLEVLASESTMSIQFSHSVVSVSLQPKNRSTPGLPVHHQLPESTQTHVHRVGDAIQPSNHLILCCPLLLLTMSTMY